MKAITLEAEAARERNIAIWVDYCPTCDHPHPKGTLEEKAREKAQEELEL